MDPAEMIRLNGLTHNDQTIFLIRQCHLWSSKSSPVEICKRWYKGLVKLSQEWMTEVISAFYLEEWIRSEPPLSCIVPGGPHLINLTCPFSSRVAVFRELQELSQAQPMIVSSSDDDVEP